MAATSLILLLSIFGLSLYTNHKDNWINYNNLHQDKIATENPLLGKLGKLKFLKNSQDSSGAVIAEKDGDHLYMWGSDMQGQQGNGPSITPDVLYPTDINPTGNNGWSLDDTIIDLNLSTVTSSVTVKDKAGKDHLYMWGDNSNGQQGSGVVGPFSFEPKEVNNASWNSDEIVSAEVSRNTSSIVTKDGSGLKHLYMWGW